MRRAAVLLLVLTGCVNLDADFQAYCRRTGRCDGGVGGGGTGGGVSTGGAWRWRKSHRGPAF